MGHFYNKCLLPKFFFIWIGLLPVIHDSLWAQSAPILPDVNTDEWRIQRFDTQHGLPHNTITAITKDHLGYLWVGTPNGLVRYDGYSFRPFNDLILNGASSFIKTLYADELGSVWVGTEQDLYVIDAQTLERIPIIVDSPLNFGIQFITGDTNSNVYATNETGVYHCTLATMSCELKPTAEDGIPLENDYIVYVAASADNTLYGYTYGNKLVIFQTDRNSWIVRNPLDSLIDTNLIDMGDGEFLFIRQDSVLARYNLITENFLSIDRIPNKQQKAVLHVANGRLYSVASDTGSLIRIRINKDPDAVLQNHVRSLFCSDNGHCWIGTLNGLFRYSNIRSPFQSFNTTQVDVSAVSRPEVSAIEADDNHLIIGTLGGGVYRFENRQKLTKLISAKAKTAEMVWALKQSLNGDIWIGAENGLFHLPKNADRYVPVSAPTGNLNHAINHIEVVNDSTILVASFAGLWLFNTINQSWIRSLHTEKNPTQRVVVQWITKLNAEQFLLGTFSSHILKWDSVDSILSTEFEDHQQLPKSSEGYWSLYLSPKGTIWIGSDAGLHTISSDGSVTRIDSDDGLSGNIVYAILPDSRGRLWVSTDRGLNVIKISDNQTDIAIRSFNTFDGLPIREFNRRAAHRSSDGELWFGGIEGLTWFDPEAIDMESSYPLVFVNQAEIRGINGNRFIKVGLIESIKLDPYESSLIVGFGAIGLYSKPVNYRYLLSGVDFDTLLAGPDRSATYTNLQPGSYTFQVWASDEFGRWPKDGTSISVLVRAAFWQTTSFRILMVVLFVGALGYAYRLRFKRILALERMRLNIAADLHDQVGSGLSSLAMMSELGAESSESERIILLKTISSSARNMAQELREIVWYTNPRFDNLNQVFERMRDLPYQLIPGCNLELHFPDSTHHTVLSPDFRRDWMMSYREALHNIAKHAMASNVRIELTMKPGQMELHIEDNGCGFDHELQSKGMGLQNIQVRINRIGGTVKWISIPEKGTIVKISVPLP